jgi:hypothetical protein
VTKLLIPNTTQIPNILLDEVMPRLSGSALKVLLIVARKTYGFQKTSDKISLSQLQQFSGMSKQSVINGIRDLGPLLKTIAGTVDGAPNETGMNEYSLNLDVVTGGLVQKLDQSKKLTSTKNDQKPVQKLDTQNQVLQNQDRAHAKRALQQPDSRIREFFDFWTKEYQARFSAPYVFAGGKEGQLVKSLLGSHDLPALQALALRFLDSSDTWIRERGGYTIGVFASQVNKLVSTRRVVVSGSAFTRELPL